MADEKALGLSVLATLRDWVKSLTSKRTEAIPYGECDSTSTATAFTATVAGVTELKDGTTVMLKNGVVTSASGFTININNLGAKPVYNNMATGNDVTPTNPTRDTTIFNINYTMLLVYSTEIVSGGGWICYRGYDANTNTIGYQLRTNSGNLPASDTGYRYRLWLTSADGTEWVPINTSTETNATTARTLNTRKIDPFGAIVYNSTNGTTNANARPAVATLWQQYTLTVGYSYVLSMTAWKPVYLRCTPQTDGSAVMDVLTQTLPTSKDGKIYIFLGIAYSATAMELRTEHPVYWHDGTGLRIWNGAESSGGGVEVTTTTATLTVAGWSNNRQMVNVTGVTASNDVIVTYAVGSKETYTASDIYCYAQGAGTLTFACATTPTSAITVNVMIIEGGTEILPPSAYQIINNDNCRSVTLDGSYGSGITTIETEAAAGDIVTYSHINAGVKPYIYGGDTVIETTTVGTYTVKGSGITTYYVQQFTMPSADVRLTSV